MSSLGFQFDDYWLQFCFMVWISEDGDVLGTEECAISLISSNPATERYVSAFTSQLIIEMQSETFKNVINSVSMFGFTGTYDPAIVYYCKVNYCDKLLYLFMCGRFRCEINSTVPLDE